MQSAIESNKQEMRPNKQDYDEKMKKFTEEFKSMLVVIIDNIDTLKSSPTRKDSLKPLDPTNFSLANMRAPPLDGGQSRKIDDMYTLKHDISSPRLYELFITT